MGWTSDIISAADIKCSKNHIEYSFDAILAFLVSKSKYDMCHSRIPGPLACLSHMTLIYISFHYQFSWL